MRFSSRLAALGVLLFILLPAVLAAHPVRALEGDEEIRQAAPDDKPYGVGVLISERGGQIVVARSVEGSSAHQAGIKAGDVFLAAGGRSLKGVNLTTAINTISGPKGTHVKVVILSAGGGKTVELDLVRNYLWK